MHAELLNTVELAAILHVSAQQLLDAAHTQSATAEEQINALRDLIEGVELRKTVQMEPASAATLSPAGYPVDVKMNPEPPETTASSSASSSKAPAAVLQEGPVPLHLSAEMLWLVLPRDPPPSVPNKPGI